jgi:hypothetical protein
MVYVNLRELLKDSQREIVSLMESPKEIATLKELPTLME